ncbi:hypothetical protein [Lewinella sp. JB7]|uniref:hypothetical protein n=1 Tax=Lewinella sp. JB7 TaxID=2962887 RepID=UPI0020CA19C1|nr:hypothetical protein [Lewinella sp. JB7]MCP9236310.1 hypothetical protein [Lewinella sp. JB7]
MAAQLPLSAKMRIIHRYLGFFLAGIMAVYAISGMVLIFRNTDFLKREVVSERVMQAGMAEEEVGKALGMRGFAVERTEGDVLYFPGGSYNAATGETVQTKKELPYVLDQMTHLHKANTKDPLYFFNLFFGASLLFFVISAFWMFMPCSRVMKKGLIFTGAGIVLTLILLFV